MDFPVRIEESVLSDFENLSMPVGELAEKIPLLVAALRGAAAALEARQPAEPKPDAPCPRCVRRDQRIAQLTADLTAVTAERDNARTQHRIVERQLQPQLSHVLYELGRANDRIEQQAIEIQQLKVRVEAGPKEES